MKQKENLKMLTQKQAKLFQVIVSYKNINKQYPSLGKLGRILKVDRQSVYDMIKLIVKKGYLVNIDGIYTPTIDGINQYMQDVMNHRFRR